MSTYLDLHEYEEDPVIISNNFIYTDCRNGYSLTLLKLWPPSGGRATQGGADFSINARTTMGKGDPCFRSRRVLSLDKTRVRKADENLFFI